MVIVMWLINWALSLKTSVLDWVTLEFPSAQKIPYLLPFFFSFLIENESYVVGYYLKIVWNVKINAQMQK